MHPIAVYCVLHGLVLMDFSDRSSRFYRICDAANRDTSIAVLGVEKRTDGPWICAGALRGMDCAAVPWESIPDSVYDQLTIQRIDETYRCGST